MIEIGKFNKLKVLKKSEFGLFLDAGDGKEILLPKRFVADDFEIGQELEVFVHTDSEDRLVATTQKPLAQVGEFATLKVVSLSSVGAFLDWGLAKDLLLPFAEKSRPLRVGETVLVYLYVDKSDRISATMRVEKFASSDKPEYEEGQAVDLIISRKTDLGTSAIINGKHLGMLFANEIFEQLIPGQRLQGYIKKIRPDGKIDLSLHQTGIKDADEIGQKILALLKEHGGFLEINDKTSPDLIYDYFGVSKKKYKIALGGLYKKRLITVDDDGIRLAQEHKPKRLF